jgi:hypothetical protein
LRGRRGVLDCSKLGGLTVDSTLEAGLKVVDLLSFCLGIERVGCYAAMKVFHTEDLGAKVDYCKARVDCR